MSIDLEHFARRGFVRLPGAIDPDLVTRWRANAWQRMRTGDRIKEVVPPQRAHRLDDLREESAGGRGLLRVVLDGVEGVPWSQAAPPVHEALELLLGGVDRLCFDTLHDYLIVSFPQPPPRAPRRLFGFLRRKVKPSQHPRHLGSYHLDAPGQAMRLDGIRSALLGIVLWDDVVPGGGGTLLACDSPPRVARRLAMGDGVDFVSNDEAEAIVAECEDFEEVTGSAGDVILAHAFMLHTGSPNHGGRVRIISNPLLQCSAPLAYGPEQVPRSPLEEITRSWLG